MPGDNKNIDRYSKLKRTKNWLIIHKKVLRLREIDRQLDFPINTVQKFVSGAKLNDNRLNRLFKYINKMSKF